MVCEGLLNLFGTSSEGIIAQTKKDADDYYPQKLNEMAAQIATLSEQLADCKKELATFKTNS